MTNIVCTKRKLLKFASVAASLAIFHRTLLATWPEKAFKTDNVTDAINGLWGVPASTSESSAIKLKAPDIAENGAVVPVTVSTDIEGVESIAIFVEGNPNPLAASFEINENLLADVSTRIKMGKTSNVVASVHANGKVYSARQEVKVTIGGCGG